MDQLRLNSFLKFGYFLDYENREYRFDLSGVDRRRYEGADEHELVEAGVRKTRDAITRLFTPGSDHVVPLSGGLDSRAILAGLLECADARSIYTYTFGTPGTLDFSIGNRIAAEFGTRHTSIPLDQHAYSMDELLETSHATDHQTVLFSTAPLRVIRNEFATHVHWSGAFAGPPTGNVLPEHPSRTEGEARKRFVGHKYTHVKSCTLTNCRDEELHPLLEIRWIEPGTVTYDEQLHLEFAQLRWIAPHVLPRGFDYRTPFLDRDWLGLMFGVDNRYRLKQYLYKRILAEAFPLAFSYKTKSHYGVPLGASRLKIGVNRVANRVRKSLQEVRGSYINPGINYIDFNSGIRLRRDLIDIVYQNIMDLRGRKIVDWIDIRGIWKSHSEGASDFGDALLVLASLEIHLKAIEAKG
jgi:hypothetical protein